METLARAEPETVEPIDSDGRLDATETPSSPATDERGRAVAEQWKRLVDRGTPEGLISFLIVAACTYFVFHELNPDGVIFDDTTPTGGDMGAHVWGPAFLRDDLLSSFRLSGWTSAWYLGFPAYQFYFVVPALAIVLLNVGLHPVPAAVLLAGAAMLVWRTYRNEQLARWRAHAWVAFGAVAVLVIGMPYGVAFKIVAVSGLVAMPVCAWAMGRLARLPFPGPPLLAVASLLFIFDQSFNILGGNGASTMAGEFSFAISLSLAMLYLGFLIRGLDTGKGRATAAVLLALTGLCHLIPVFFALAATGVVLFLRFGKNQIKWLGVVGVLGGLLSAFWIAPFYMRQDYLNDMGWEKYTTYSKYLWSRHDLNPDFLRDYPSMEVMVVLAAVGFVLSVLLRRRLGVLLGLWAAGVAIVFVGMGEDWPLLSGDRLWNARLLPFYYLCVYMLAVLAIGELLALVARAMPRRLDPADPERYRRWGRRIVPAVVFIAVFFTVAMPLGAVPGGDRGDDGAYAWGPISTKQRNFVPGWAHWNFSGYENKSGDSHGGGYGEYHGIVSTMDEVGQEHGCGQSFWEFAPELTRYGTTMAMMLLPHWTDGCIGSMEGLYFEASSTVPYHFLMQTELSGPPVTPEGAEDSVGGPSKPMRGLPYTEFDIDTGVDHMQMLGVEYYLAFSDAAVTAADAHPDLTEIDSSDPWHVYRVADAPRVEGLANEPVVWENVSDHQDEWLDPSVSWFQSPQRWGVYQASSGPDEWQRIGPDELADLAEGGEVPYDTRPLPEVAVTDISYGEDSISFDVDQVGVPVVVKASYFPNWQASGADGPYRVAPNMMVVIPTEESVTLTYGRTPIDMAAIALTLLGIVGVILVARRATPDSTAWFDWVEWMDLEAAEVRRRRQLFEERLNAAAAETPRGPSPTSDSVFESAPSTDDSVLAGQTSLFDEEPPPSDPDPE